jgi:hypothetical protein
VRRHVIAALTIQCLIAGAHANAPTPALVIDDMATPTLWKALASDGVVSRLEPISTPDPALRLQFDFQHHAGYAALERALPLDLPENFEIDLMLGGTAPINDLEVKLLDASGENVWWYRRPNFEFQKGLRSLAIRRRQIEFAWGPTQDRRLHHVERLQLVISAGRGGGAGSMEIGPIRLLPLLPAPAAWPAPTASAGGQAAAVPDGNTNTAWRCLGETGGCELLLDWQLPREFGGLRLDWDPSFRPARYEVAASMDGVQWRLLRHFTAAAGPSDRLWLPDEEARYLRFRVSQASGQETLLRKVTLEEPSFGASRNALLASIARDSPRGYLPRGFSEQSFWTLAGTDGVSQSALLSEDGAIETQRGGPSIEPFVVEDGRLLGWADVKSAQSLEDNYLPLPRVTWKSPNWSLAISTAAGSGASSGLYGRYLLRNISSQRRHLRLVLALRPFQVNPAAQFLTTPGGVSPIDNLAWDGHALLANKSTRVIPLFAPTRVGLFAFESNSMPAVVASADWGSAPATTINLADESQLGSGAMAFDADLAPGASARFGILVPWSGQEPPPASAGLADKAQSASRAEWRSRLNRVQIIAPDSREAQDVAQSLRTAEAHILMSRDGPVLRPGTRSYARSWIRDGAMMSAALLRLGETGAAQDYLQWYSTYLFADGKVPCCVDARGADPVPEHDSSGEFIYLAAEVYRLGGDRALVAKLWPQVRDAAAYLERLRQSTRTGDSPNDASMYFGLLPPSISHEGYSAKPMHSYWDDFWALRGYADATFLAKSLGMTDDAQRLTAQRAQFAHEVSDSLQRVVGEKRIDFIPGAADLGDFDATSTTIVLAPGVGALDLPPGLLESTFERYWREFVARRNGVRPWKDYTPYEWRNVGAFVRLGWRDRAHQAVQYFMADRKPQPWNQWPEVIGRLPREARFIGDLPHGWVASDFIRSALDLFAYERESDDAIVLAAGVPLSWLEKRGIRVRGMRTAYGSLGYTLQHAKGALELRLPGGMRVPPGGFVLPIPGSRAGGVARVNGRAVPFSGGSLNLRTLPCRVRIPLQR